MFRNKSVFLYQKDKVLTISCNRMKKILFAMVLALATVGTQAQLLYRISGKGLTAPSYIVGTYHLASVSFVDSIPGMRQAMADTQQTYGELLMEEMLAPDSLAMMQQAMMLPDSLTLDKLLTAEEMGRLNAYMRQLMGMDMTNPMVALQMGKLSPSALSTTLSMISYMKKSGMFDPLNGFDNYFQKEAHAQGKTIGGLETIAFQTETLFKSQTLERQKELLMCQIDNAAFMDKMAEEVTAAFYRQDIEGIKKAMDAKLDSSCDSSPEEEAQLIGGRNADWLTKMPAIMADRSTFFAVGAGHLPGDDGVLHLLRQAGYTVEGM